jgi:anti-sigma regulatory factor (Ser/Thr protein kinase)
LSPVSLVAQSEAGRAGTDGRQVACAIAGVGGRNREARDGNEEVRVSGHPFPDAPLPTGPGTLLHRRAGYDHVPGSITAARDLAHDFLAELVVKDLVTVSERTAGDVLLVVSELVTNAERHDGGPRLMDLSCTRDLVEVAVWDTSPAMPVRMPPDPSRIGGHGIEIAARLCAHLHAERVIGGKRVRAGISLP